MKTKILRLTAFFLCLTAILSCASCSRLEPIQPENTRQTNKEKTTQEFTETEESVQDEKTLMVPDPLTWDKINAIPIATPNMTEDELRKICVDYFRLQLSYQWTPSESFSYLIEAYDRKVDMKKDSLYMGSPYDGGRGNLYKIMNIYDSETGILSTSKNGEYTTQIIGNNCSSASHWGWSRVSNTFRFTHTVTITEANGAIKLGPYQYENEGKNHKSTREVCQANGEQVMFQSYTLLKPADGVVCYNGSGHVMMVSGTPHVEVLPDGSIDGKNSYVPVMEQTSSWEDVDFGNETFSQQGRVDRNVSFASLYKSTYLPFTLKELIGTDPVEQGYAKLECEENPSLKNLADGKIVSNYEISDVTVRVLDGNGKEAYSYVCNGDWLEYEKKLNKAVFPARISPFAKKGGHKIEILCRIGTGELFTVYSGELV